MCPPITIFIKIIINKCKTEKIIIIINSQENPTLEMN